MRIPDEVWDAALAKSSEVGTSISAVISQLLSGWLIDGTSDSLIEYLAIPKAEGAQAVAGITCEYSQARKMFPPAAWELHERTVSPYRPAQRRVVSPTS